MYLWADASPQHGVDWFLSTLLWIPEAHVLDAVADAHLLAVSAQRFQDVVGSGEAIDDSREELESIACERDAAGRRLRSSLKTHRQLPMGLGSGRSSVEYKLKCLLQKLYPESHSDLSNILNRILACCVDLGTEASMPDVGGVTMGDLAPSWMSPDMALLPDGGHEQSGSAPPLAMQEATIPKESPRLQNLN